MKKTALEKRIKQLELEVEVADITSETFAEDLVSIVRPYLSGDAAAMGSAIRAVAKKHVAMLGDIHRVAH